MGYGSLGSDDDYRSSSMKIIIEVEFPKQISTQREQDAKRIIQDFKEEIEAYGGKLVRADMVKS